MMKTTTISIVPALVRVFLLSRISYWCHAVSSRDDTLLHNSPRSLRNATAPSEETEAENPNAFSKTLLTLFICTSLVVVISAAVISITIYYRSDGTTEPKDTSSKTQTINTDTENPAPIPQRVTIPSNRRLNHQTSNHQSSHQSLDDCTIYTTNTPIPDDVSMAESGISEIIGRQHHYSMTSTVEMTPSIRSFLKDSRQYDQNERPSTAVVGSSRPGTNRRHQVYDTSTASNISEARRPVSTKRPGLYPSSNDTVGGDVSLASLYSMDQLYPRDDDFFQKSNRIVPKRGVDGDDEDLDAWSVKPGGLEDVDLDDDDDSSSAASF